MCQSREEKNVHGHHRKKIFWGTFLVSKKNFPGRWWIPKPYENPMKTISTTEIFPQWAPFFPAKKSSALEQGGVCFFFSRSSTAPLHCNLQARVCHLCCISKLVPDWGIRDGVMSESRSVLMAESEIATVADVLTKPTWDMLVPGNFSVTDAQGMTDRIP